MRRKLLALALAMVFMLSVSGLGMAQYSDEQSHEIFFTMSAFSLNVAFEPHTAFTEMHEAPHQYFSTVAFTFFVDAVDHIEDFHLDVWVQAGDGYWDEYGTLVAADPAAEGEIGFKYDYSEFVEQGPDDPYEPPDEPLEAEWLTKTDFLPLAPANFLFENLSTFRWEGGTPPTHHVLYVKGLAHDSTPGDAQGHIIFHFNATED